jgi:hypothetical protein
MLSPAPSVKAAVPLGTQAHNVTWVRPGFKLHAVWIVLVVLPALAAVLAASVKFTAPPPVTFTERDSDSVAFKTTVRGLELIWAFAAGGIVARTINPTAINSTLSKLRM